MYIHVCIWPHHDSAISYKCSQGWAPRCPIHCISYCSSGSGFPFSTTNLHVASVDCTCISCTCIYMYETHTRQQFQGLNLWNGIVVDLFILSFCNG